MPSGNQKPHKTKKAMTKPKHIVLSARIRAKSVFEVEKNVDLYRTHMSEAKTLSYESLTCLHKGYDGAKVTIFPCTDEAEAIILEEGSAQKKAAKLVKLFNKPTSHKVDALQINGEIAE